MRFLAGFFELAGTAFAICVWWLIQQQLWDHGYKLLAITAFLLIPAAYFELACSYHGWRESRCDKGGQSSSRDPTKL